MIVSLRKHFGRKFLLFIVWITILSVGGMGIIGMLVSRLGFLAKKEVKGIAEVNGYVITPLEYSRKVNELEHTMAEMRRQLARLGFTGGPEVYGMKNPKEQAYTELVTQKLLHSVADSLHIRLSQDYIAERLRDPSTAQFLLREWVPAALLNQPGISYRQIFANLQRAGVSLPLIESILEERLAGAFAIQLLQSSAYVPLPLVKEQFDKTFRKKSYEIMLIPLAPFIKEAKKKPVTDEQLKRLFEESNLDQHHYWLPEMRSGKIWHFESVPAHFETEARHAMSRGGAFLDSLVKKYHGKEEEIPLGPHQHNHYSYKLFALPHRGIDIIMSGKDKADIVQVTGIQPTKEQPFEVVKSQVCDDYQKIEAAKELMVQLEALKTKSHSARSAWAKSHGGSDKITNFLDPKQSEDFKPYESFKKELLSLGVPGSVVTGITPTEGYLAELKAFDPQDEQLFSDKKGDIYSDLIESDKRDLSLGFIASLEKHAKIKKNTANIH